MTRSFRTGRFRLRRRIGGPPDERGEGHLAVVVKARHLAHDNWRGNL